MDYAERFQTAQDRTSRFALPQPSVAVTAARFLGEAGQLAVGDVAQRMLGECTARDIADRCADIHVAAVDPIGQALSCDPVLTIGYLRIAGRVGFLHDEAGYQALLDAPFPPSKLDLHCWLTLPSMEIIDLTGPTGLVVSGVATPDHIGALVMGHPDELADDGTIIEYCPMLVGAAFLWAIGLRPVTW